MIGHSTEAKIYPAKAKAQTSVLVIDDEPELVRFLARAFESLDCEVKTAFDGFEALEKLGESQGVDLVLLDIGLPKMSGLEVLERVNRLFPRTKILISTGYTVDFKPQELKALNIVGILSKPFSMGELIAAAEKALTKN